MNLHVNSTPENQNQSVSNETAQKKSSESSFQFIDNRPEAIAQSKRQDMVDNSPQVSQLMSFQEMADNSLQVQQAAQLQSIANGTQVVQRNPKDAPTIAAGHAYGKHVVNQKEWGDPPMVQADFKAIVQGVMDSPDETKDLKKGRKAYWKGDTIVIHDPSSGDKGTCFKPTAGKAYFDKQK